MQIVGHLVALFARDVARNVVHGPWTVERHDGDDVFEGIGLHLAQDVAHALTFQLEHARRLAATDHFEGRGVVQRNGRQIDFDPLFPAQLHGGRQHGQGP